jgi:large subunit ribosomal protein L9
MKLILKRDVEKLGERGDIVSVKPGFARNYLLPQGLAYEANEANLQRIEVERGKAEERAKRDYLEARRRASLLEGTVLGFKAKASEEGKLFGSVTALEIFERLATHGLDFEVERRMILLEEPIKEVGATTVEIRLHPEVQSEIEIQVERE